MLAFWRAIPAPPHASLAKMDSLPLPFGDGVASV
jgi:hypothetical protein